MIIMKKEIDYKNAKYTEKELKDFMNKMGIVYDEEKLKKLNLPK